MPSMLANLDSYLLRGINALTGTVLIDRPLVVYRLHTSNIFSRTPAVANLRAYDANRPDNDHRIPALEAIETLLSLAEVLATSLEWSGIFIEVIETLSATWPGVRPTMPVSSYTLEFLTQNKDKLKKAFGNTVYTSWLRRYIRSLKDIIFLAQSAANSYLGRSAKRDIRSSAKTTPGGDLPRPDP
jgi:hypothetical protein